MTGAVLIPVDDPEDPRVAAYREMRERDLVGRQGLFVAEGEVVLRVLLGPHSRFKAVSVLVAKSRLHAIQSLLANTAPVPVFVADQAVMDRISGFPMHRGIVAIGEAGTQPSASQLLASLPGPVVVVAALGIANHDNLGGIFRNAAAFGAGAVLLDRASCNPLYRKAIRVSVGMSLTVPFARLAEGEDALTLLASAGFDLVALSPGGSRTLDEVAPSERVALVVGAEGAGLSRDLLRRVSAVRIPMAPGVDSLNVAVATGIVLHHLSARR